MSAGVWNNFVNSQSCVRANNSGLGVLTWSNVLQLLDRPSLLNNTSLLWFRGGRFKLLH